MTPHGGQIHAIFAAVIPQRSNHVGERVTAVVRQVRIAVRLVGCGDDLQQPHACGVAGTVHVHYLLRDVGITTRFGLNLCNHRIDLCRVVGVETNASHSRHGHAAPLLRATTRHVDVPNVAVICFRLLDRRQTAHQVKTGQLNGFDSRIRVNHISGGL